MQNRLFLFTASFPYGHGESFIANEIDYLSKEFDIVIIFPLIYGSTKIMRKVPHNIQVLEPLIQNKTLHYLKNSFTFKAFNLYKNEVIRKKIYFNPQKIKTLYIDSCITNSLLRSNKLKFVLDNLIDTDILYFYWGKGFSNILPFIPKIKSKKIVRFHRVDLYEDEQSFIPITLDILKSADLSVFISNHGRSYIHRKFPNNNFKSIVSYLGTEESGISNKSTDGIFRLLSCSFVHSVKRLSLIYESLQTIEDTHIEWTHIGDGSEYGNLQMLAGFSRDNIKIRLLGAMSNQEVLEYYRLNPVDAFINVSSSEGLPVSIMEAISFNIPVIATNVGGTSEIVNEQTGILLSSAPTLIELVSAIKSIPNLALRPKLFWKNNFESSMNYKKFIKEIKKL